MKLQQIRNATVKLQHDNQILSVDPMLSNKGTLPSMSNTNGNTEKNRLLSYLVLSKTFYLVLLLLLSLTIILTVGIPRQSTLFIRICQSLSRMK